MLVNTFNEGDKVKFEAMREDGGWPRWHMGKLDRGPTGIWLTGVVVYRGTHFMSIKTHGHGYTISHDWPLLVPHGRLEFVE